MTALLQSVKFVKICFIVYLTDMLRNTTIILGKMGEVGGGWCGGDDVMMMMKGYLLREHESIQDLQKQSILHSNKSIHTLLTCLPLFLSHTPCILER